MDRCRSLDACPSCRAPRRYLIHRGYASWLGELALSAAAWHLAVRERCIGWSPVAREQNLPQLPTNSRFLPLPVVRALHLTGYMLGFEARAMVLTWQALDISVAAGVTDLVHLGRKTTDPHAIYPLKTAARRHGLACPRDFVLCSACTDRTGPV